MRRVLLVGALLVVSGIAACTWLLPEKYAVNAPLAHVLLGRGTQAPTPQVVETRMQVPEGFALTIWAEGVRGARVLRFTPTGDLLVSAPVQNSVLLVERDADGDGRADGHRALLDNLSNPHGIDLHEHWLYVAETGAIGRVPFDPGRPKGSATASGARLTGELERINTDLPSAGQHWTRTLRFGPDGWLYVSVGSTCNVCWEKNPQRRAALLRFRPDGSGEQTFATGLRNMVGFDWHPVTGTLYGTDNGRDLLGDNFPPCELNELVEGGFYGFPVANGNRVPDPDLGQGEDARIAASIEPAHGFNAHNAPLGMTFVRSQSAPPDYQGAALVALHGSWNRRQKDGYKVVSLHWQPDGSIQERDFITGFLRDENVIGRPADVVEGPDGAFYISDDYAGVIWRAAPVGGGSEHRAGNPTEDGRS